MDVLPANGLQVRERSAWEQGDMPAAARQALLSRLDRLQPALRLRELSTITGTSTGKNSMDSVPASSISSEQAAVNQGQAPLPQTPTSKLQVNPAADEGRDGAMLRQVQVELRALRAEIYQLSRALGYTSRDSNRTEYRGIIQQRDELESDVRLLRWRADDNDATGRIAAAQKRAEAARVTQRQRELLRALQRAERRLAEAPKNLPPGLRDGIIGEIYRARYSIAMFGGASGTAQLSGMEYDTAI